MSINNFSDSIKQNIAAARDVTSLTYQEKCSVFSKQLMPLVSETDKTTTFCMMICQLPTLQLGEYEIKENIPTPFSLRISPQDYDVKISETEAEVFIDFFRTWIFNELSAEPVIIEDTFTSSVGVFKIEVIRTFSDNLYHFSLSITLPSGVKRYMCLYDTDVDGIYSVDAAHFTLYFYHQIWNQYEIFNGYDLSLEYKALSNELVCGKGMTNAFADILQSLSQNNADQSSVTSVIVAKINSYDKVLPTSIYQGLLDSAKDGGNGIYNFIANYFNGLHSGLSNEGDTFLSGDGRISYAQYSFGMLGTAIAGVVTIAGAILTVINPIIGILVSVGGLLISTFANVFTNVVLNKQDTYFRVTNHKKVSCFDLCIDRGLCTSPDVLNVLDTLECTTGTIYVDGYPTVTFVHPVDQSDLNQGVYFETYLSADYDVDLITDIGVMNDDYPSSPNIAINFTIKDNNNQNNTVIKAHPGNFQSPASYHGVRSAFFWRIQNDFWNDNTLMSSILSQCYNPLSLNVLSRIPTSNMDTILASRFFSALILMCLAAEYNFARAHTAWDFEITEHYYGLCLPNNNYSDWTVPDDLLSSNYLVYKTYYLMLLGQRIIDSVITNSSYAIYGVDRDGIFQALLKLFDGLPVSDYGKDDSITLIPVPIWTVEWVIEDNVGNDYPELLDSLDTSNDWGFDVVLNPFQHQTIYIDQLYGINQDRSNSSYPDELGLATPPISFGAYVIGLIASGFFAIAAIATIVIGFIGFKKLLWKRTQMQNDLESKWYEMQEDNIGEVQPDGSMKYIQKTDAQKQADFKAYKSARLKYNLLAIATGGTTVGRGLYDDTGSSEVLDTVVGAVSSSSYNDDGVPNNLLSEIRSLIKPYDV